jgi:hypothetical protein
MDVQLPDGTTVRGVPDGTSKADLFAKLKANGHPVDDSWLGTASPAKAPEQPPQSLTGFVGGNLAKGAAQVAGIPAEVGKQLLSATESPAAEKLNKIIKAPAARRSDQPMAGSTEHIEQILKNVGAIGPSAEPRSKTQEVVAAGLQALPSAALPGGGAKLLPRIGAAVGSGVGGEIGRQVGGTPGQVAGSLLGGAAGGLAGAPRGIPAPPSEAARASKASGIPLTLGQETGNKTLTFTENVLRDLFPSAGTAHRDEMAQVTAGVNRIDKLASQMGTATADPEAIGNQLRTSYKNTVEKIDSLRESQAKTDYAAVKQVAGNKPVVGYKNTMATLDKIIAENENVPSGDARKIAAQARSIKEALTTTKAGAAASPILGPNGQPIKGATPATTGPATHTIDDAMKTRSAWGKAARRTGNIFNDIDPNANQVLAKRLFGAINRDFDDASTAKTPIAQALAKANQNYKKASQSIDFIQKSALGKLLGEDTVDAAFSGATANTKAPELIAKRYLNMQPSEAKSVTAILQQHDPQTLQDVKAYVLRNGLEQAKNDIPGAPPISFAKFRKEIDKVEPKLAEMGFSPKEIKDIKDVTDTMARAGDKVGVNTSKTTPTAHLIATVSAAAAGHLGAAAAAAVTPYIASQALLTQTGRNLLRAAYNASNGKAQAAALGALRAQYAQPNGDRSQTSQAPSGTQIPSPPQ